MKKFLLITVIAVFHFICSGGIQAQTTTAKLNQVRLMKQFLGTWKTEFKNGDAMILEFTSFGAAIVSVRKNIHADTIIFTARSVWGYNRKEDKIIQAEIDSSYPDISIQTFWFKTENTLVSQKEVSSFSGDTLSTRFEFKNPDLLLITTINNSRDIETYKHIRTEN